MKKNLLSIILAIALVVAVVVGIVQSNKLNSATNDKNSLLSQLVFLFL